MSINERVAVLREAASAIRKEWADRGTAWSVVQNYHLAAADWLDGEAACLGGMEPLVDLLNAAYENESGVVGYLKFQRSDDGELTMRSDTTPAAERFALAYLGRTPPTPAPEAAPAAVDAPNEESKR